MPSMVPSRELRNSTRAVLDRVDAGEEITITVNGRPAAKLCPIDHRPDSMSKERFIETFLRGGQADPGMADDLHEMIGDETTDDLEDPWASV